MGEGKLPREFYIPRNYENEFHSGIHVIEMSAYQVVTDQIAKLQKENEILRAGLQSIAGTSDNAIFDKWVNAIELRDDAAKTLNAADKVKDGQ